MLFHNVWSLFTIIYCLCFFCIFVGSHLPLSINQIILSGIGYRKLLSVKNEKLTKNFNVSSITSSFITNDNNNYINTIKEKSDFPISALFAMETNEQERASDSNTIPFHPFQTSSSFVNSNQNTLNPESNSLSQEIKVEYNDTTKIIDDTISADSHLEAYSTSFSSSYVRKENDSTYSSEFLTEQPTHSPTSPSTHSPTPSPSPHTPSPSQPTSSSPSPHTPSSSSHPQHFITIDTTDPSLSYSRKHPHPQDPSNITFFPWDDDDIDYSATCSKLISIIKSFSGPIIVNSGFRGGLGHKFLSLYYSLTIALLLRRPFYLDWSDIYMNNLNSCFQSLKFTGDRDKLVQCPKTRKCFKKQSIVSLIHKDVLLIDNRFYGGTLKNYNNLQLLNKLNITGKKLTWKEYRRVIFRLMSNPTPAMTKIILEKRKELGPIENVLSVHIRCGGQLADTPEKQVIIPKKRVLQIPFQIEDMIKRSGHISVIYLTTDSSKTEQYLRQSLSNNTIFTLATYKRGHSTTDSVSEDSLRRSILDIYLAAQAKHLVYTQKSGFSATICIIGNASDQLGLESDIIR